ncbi:hypothetical protein PLCT2_02596 [Planctomycetaceae bacterium]|nr:hypothetical protein PLCT2_02596 [Planctomycetaceae bacterium]
MTTHCATALIIAPPGRLRESLRVLVRAVNWIAQIELADDGPAGLRLIADYSPALVLLDTLLPEEQVWETLRQIKLKRATVRCVVLAQTRAQEQQAQVAGADGVLLNGFSSEAFFDLMEVQKCQKDATT